MKETETKRETEDEGVKFSSPVHGTSGLKNRDPQSSQDWNKGSGFEDLHLLLF
jgi:hypothetical protein